MAYTLDFALALGAGKAGLTLAAQLVDTSGANVGSEVTTGFVEIGGGNYLWHYAAFPDGHRGGVKFYEDGVPGTILAFAAVNPEEAEYVDTAVSAVEADTQDIQGRLPAALVGGLMNSNMDALTGDATAASLLYRLAEAIVQLTVTETGQTTQFTTSLTGLDESLVLNRLLYYPDTGSGPALRRIVAYSSLNGRLTLDTALPFTTTSGNKIYFLPVSAEVDAVAISGSTDAADGVEANIGNLDMAISGVAAAVVAAMMAITTASITTAGTFFKFILDKLGLIISGSITVQSPLSEDGQTMNIVQGDDYYAADGRSFDWSSGDWPDLTGATVVWTATKPAVPIDTFTENVTVVTPGTGTQTIRLELPNATTKQMTAGDESYHFDVQATLSGSSHIITLVPPESVVNVDTDITDN